MKKSEYSGLYGDYSLDIDPEALDFDDEDDEDPPAESEQCE